MRAKSANSPWESTKVAGVRRYKKTGALYFSVRLSNGKTKSGALYQDGCDDPIKDDKLAKAVLALKIAKLEAELAAAPAEPVNPLTIGDKPASEITFGDLIGLYNLRIDGKVNWDQKTKAGRKHVVDTFVFSWNLVPKLISAGKRDFLALRPAQVTYDDLLAWQTFFLADCPKRPRGREVKNPRAVTKGYSDDSFNKTLRVATEVFELATECGVKLPADNQGKTAIARIDFCKIERASYKLPTIEDFTRILALAAPSASRDLVEALSWTGLRKDEAKKLLVENVNLKDNYLFLPDEIVKGKKGKKQGRIVPLFKGPARALFARLVAEADPVTRRVFKANDANERLHNLCKKAGWTETFTVHSLRHYFTTRCLEAGIPVPTVAAYLGHKDKGALLLEVYAHVCPQHLLKVAEELDGWCRVRQTPDNIVKIDKAA
jgi:integrase